MRYRQTTAKQTVRWSDCWFSRCRKRIQLVGLVFRGQRALGGAPSFHSQHFTSNALHIMSGDLLRMARVARVTRVARALRKEAPKAIALHDDANRAECLDADFIFRDVEPKRKTPTRKHCEWHNNAIIQNKSNLLSRTDRCPSP